MTSPATLDNPAPISASLGDVSFLLLAPAVSSDTDTRPPSPTANGPVERLVPLGSILMPNLSMKPGVNELPSVLATFHPDVSSATAARTGLALLKSYLTNTPSTVVIRGYPGSTPIPYLKDAVAGLEIRTTLPGLPEKFIEGASLVLPTPGDLWSGTIRSRLAMRNPFDCEMSVEGVKGTVTITGGLMLPQTGLLSGLAGYLPTATGPTPLGTLDCDPLTETIELGAMVTSTSPALPMTPLISIPALTGIIGQLSEGRVTLTVDVEAEMKVRVGEYDVGRLGSVGYRQEGVTVGVALS